MTHSRIDVIPDSHRALLDGPIVVRLATQMRSGQIQVQPVWCSYDVRRDVFEEAGNGVLFRIAPRRVLTCGP